MFQISINNPGFGETDSNYVDNLWNIAREMAGRCHNEINRSHRWIGDIVTEVRSSELFDLIESATEWNNNYGSGRVFGIIFHPETDDHERGHLHIYHSCVYRNSTCKCGFIRLFGKLKHRFGRRSVYVDSLCNPVYWYQFLRYFLSKPRRLLFLEISQRSFYRALDRLKDLSERQEIETGETFGMLETCDIQGESRIDGQEKSRESDQTETLGETLTNGIDPVHKRRKRDQESSVRKIHHKKNIKLHKDLVGAIKEFLCVPFFSTCELKEWVEDSQLTFFDKSDVDYKRAVNELQRRSQHLSLSDIKEWITSSTREPVWYARNENHYMDLESSIDVLMKLLTHQYNTHDEIKQFIERLYNILERKLPKRNTMYIVGEANSGKTYFFDCVAALMLNVGHVENMVRGQNFPLNDCVSRRILMWNEPNIMLSAYDTVKMLAGGDPCPANVQYQGHSVISRTPLIMTGNSFVFNNTPVWMSRMFKETWRRADFLKDIKGYSSPRAMLHVFEMYVTI